MRTPDEQRRLFDRTRRPIATISDHLANGIGGAAGLLWKAAKPVASLAGRTTAKVAARAAVAAATPVVKALAEPPPKRGPVENTGRFFYLILRLLSLS